MNGNGLVVGCQLDTRLSGTDNVLDHTEKTFIRSPSDDDVGVDELAVTDSLRRWHEASTAIRKLLVERGVHLCQVVCNRLGSDGNERRRAGDENAVVFCYLAVVQENKE